MISRNSFYGALCVPGLLLFGVTNAHHSQTFFSDELTEFAGELLELEWRNPHVTMTVSVNNTQTGQAEDWEFEFDSIYVLRRMGVNSGHFPIGEQVRIVAYPSTQVAELGLAMNMMRADGQEVLLHSRTIPRLSDQVIGIAYGSDTASDVPDAAAENRGIFRVWSSPRLGYHEMHLPLRDAAIAARSSFDLTDNFATRCEPEGLPRLMRNPHPFEFVDRTSEILLHSELYELVRTIYMEEPANAGSIPASPLGYSVGHWEDDQTLVVTTTRINWPYFDNIGTPQSEDVEIVERFTLTEDQSRLDYHATVTDPHTFTEPATIAGYWLALGEEIESYRCSAY